jgi:hypothetical protein
MVKMKISSDSEYQQISKLNKFFLIIDKIRKVGCDERQGINKLRISKLIPSGGDYAPVLLSTSSENSNTANRSFDPPT